jgi:hypothetical protein
MDEPHKIISVRTLHEDTGVSEWSIGDTVKVNNPEHGDHGLLGEIVIFQIWADPEWKAKETDDQGVIIPMVALYKDTPRPTLFGIPFERLTKPTPLEQLAAAKALKSSLAPKRSLQPSAPLAKIETDDDSISI